MTIKEFEIQYALGSLSIEALEKLADSKTSKKVLSILATDKGWVVRSYIAMNPNTPKEVLIELSKDGDTNVRYWVASNPNAPKDILEKLSTDDNSDVRFSVARALIKER